LSASERDISHAELNLKSIILLLHECKDSYQVNATDEQDY